MSLKPASLSFSTMSLSEILQILSVVLLEKVPVTQVLTKNTPLNENFQIHNQLLLFDLQQENGIIAFILSNQ